MYWTNIINVQHGLPQHFIAYVCLRKIVGWRRIQPKQWKLCHMTADASVSVPIAQKCRNRIMWRYDVILQYEFVGFQFQKFWTEWFTPSMGQGLSSTMWYIDHWLYKSAEILYSLNAVWFIWKALALNVKGTTSPSLDRPLARQLVDSSMVLFVKPPGAMFRPCSPTRAKPIWRAWKKIRYNIFVVGMVNWGSGSDRLVFDNEGFLLKRVYFGGFHNFSNLFIATNISSELR